jgi:hypothetical protein
MLPMARCSRPAQKAKELNDSLKFHPAIGALADAITILGDTHVACCREAEGHRAHDDPDFEVCQDGA